MEGTSVSVTAIVPAETQEEAEAKAKTELNALAVVTDQAWGYGVRVIPDD